MSTALRQIDPNVVYVQLKKSYNDTYTAKIYMRDEESGKNIVVLYPERRACIYMFYKNKAKISINLFQNSKAITVMMKSQANTDRMLGHIQKAKERDREERKNHLEMKPVFHSMGGQYSGPLPPQKKKRFRPKREGE